MVVIILLIVIVIILMAILFVIKKSANEIIEGLNSLSKSLKELDNKAE